MAEAARKWLADNPDAIVGAIAVDGRPVPIPEEVPLLPSHQVDARSLLDLVAADEVPKVVDAFVLALRRGASTVKVGAAANRDGSIAVHYADVRERWGVVLRGVLVEDGQVPRGSATPGSPAVVAVSGASSSNALEPVAERVRRAKPRLAVMEKDVISTILSVDEATGTILGWEPAEMVGRPSLDFIHPADQTRAVDNWMGLLANGVEHSVRLRYRHKDGSWIWLETSNAIHDHPDGTRTISGQMIDVSAEMAAMEALHHSEKLLRRVTETVPVGLLELASDGSVTYHNLAMAKLFGEYGVASATEMVDLLAAADRQTLEEAIARALVGGADSDVEVRLAPQGQVGERLCGVAVRSVVDDGAVLGAVLCLTDITELGRRAASDPLTGLANRSSVISSLTESLSGHHPVGVVFVDLDYFKRINDEHGHEAGDLVLRNVADSLRRAARAGDTVGRVGGDEFVVVVPDATAPEALMEVACRIQGSIRAGLEALPGQLSCHPSVGAAWVPRGSSLEPEQVVARADAAMYLAKRQRDLGGPALWREEPHPDAVEADLTGTAAS